MIEEQFRSAIQAAGIEPPVEIIPDGRLHRFSSSGKKSDQSGWYIFHPDKPAAGQFGCWRSGISQTWCSKSKAEMTSDERSEFERRMEEAKRASEDARKAERAKAAAKAAGELRDAQPAKPDHPYLKKKGVKPYLIRQDAAGRLLVPMVKDDRLVGLQRIGADGSKRFMQGSDKRGSAYLLAGDPGTAETILIAEGFSTAATIHEATGLPVFIAFDCGNLKPAAEAIRKKHPDAKIIVCGDDDQREDDINPGRDAAEKAARAVNGSWIVPNFKGLDTSGKPTDFNDLAALAGLGVVKMQIDVTRTQAAKPGRRTAPYPTVSTEDADGRKKSQATILIELSANLKYIVNHDGDVFVVIERDGHSECWPARSKDFTEWLSQAFYWTTNKGCNRNALSDAMNTIEARAKGRCKKRCDVYIRVANSGNRIYINHCDEKWHVIEVDADGWRVLDKSPVHFTRKRGMSAFPNLEGLDGTDKKGAALLGASIDSLKSFLNIEENDFPLVIGWLMAALGGSAPYPILVLQGEQGTGKSTTSKVIRSLVDPSTSPLRSSPREIRDLLVSAVNNHVVVLDNLSGLSPDISDALCRLSTGGVIDARQLYTDLEQVLVEVQRPVTVNGIDDIATRPRSCRTIHHS